MSPDTEVLIVDDDPDEAELTRLALEKNELAARHFIVKDGAEALEFLFGSGRYAGRGLPAPRLVLLDLKMPRMDGFEVLKALRGDPRTRMLPVVVLTSSAQDEDVARSYALGANGYVVKPVDFDAFVAAVADAGLYWLRLNRPPP
jgi:two-component system response regulator